MGRLIDNERFRTKIRITPRPFPVSSVGAINMTIDTTLARPNPAGFFYVPPSLFHVKHPRLAGAVWWLFGVIRVD